MDGFIVIDKPCGITSHDVVAAVRRILGQKKVGHTGTLDPFATGVLPVAVGEGTKAIPYLDESSKEYLATMLLGVATDTQDSTGQVLSEREWRHLTVSEVTAVISSFVGRSVQIPPMFSAIKQNGVPLYRLARKGQEVVREAREIVITALAVREIDLPRVTFAITCSRGTYVRTLAHDIGSRLGCGAHLTELRRIRSGPFELAKAVGLQDLALLAEQGSADTVMVSPLQALNHLCSLPLAQSGCEKVCHGVAPSTEDIERLPEQPLPCGERLCLVREGMLLAVAENLVSEWQGAGKKLRLLRVFNEGLRFTHPVVCDTRSTENV